MILYRYEFVDYGMRFPDTDLRLYTFSLVKETPKGYWIIQNDWFQPRKRWVSKTAKKRYAYPTKQEALTSFIKRKQRYIKILEHKIMSNEAALNVAKQLKL